MVFLLMGVADAMGPLSDAVEKRYALSSFTSTLLPFAVFIAFALFSVPGGLLAGQIGKKNLLLLGLGLNALALLVPSAVDPGFSLLLACIFVLGVGTTLLQVAGNPLMRDVSRQGRFSRNLSIAQGVKGLGSASSAYLVTAVASIGAFQSLEWRSAFPMLLALMVIALVLVATLRINETQPDLPPSISSSLALLKEPVFALAVLGIFLYVGAEVCLGRFSKPALSQLGYSEEAAARYGPAAFFLLLTLGRLSAGVVLNFIDPDTCLRGSAMLGLLGALCLMTGSELLTPIGIVLSGLGFANIWPMLFSITVEHRPDRANELSGLMCMAISGGAIVPLAMGYLVDLSWGPLAFAIPAASFVYLAVLSLCQTRMSGYAASSPASVLRTVASRPGEIET
jgi:FHS family L-fucose permease-like MFS transporter